MRDLAEHGKQFVHPALKPSDRHQLSCVPTKSVDIADVLALRCAGARRLLRGGQVSGPDHAHHADCRNHVVHGAQRVALACVNEFAQRPLGVGMAAEQDVHGPPQQADHLVCGASGHPGHVEQLRRRARDEVWRAAAPRDSDGRGGAPRLARLGRPAAAQERLRPRSAGWFLRRSPPQRRAEHAAVMRVGTPGRAGRAPAVARRTRETPRLRRDARVPKGRQVRGRRGRESRHPHRQGYPGGGFEVPARGCQITGVEKRALPSGNSRRELHADVGLDGLQIRDRWRPRIRSPRVSHSASVLPSRSEDNPVPLGR